jgi:hypothetical protein
MAARCSTSGRFPGLRPIERRIYWQFSRCEERMRALTLLALLTTLGLSACAANPFPGADPTCHIDSPPPDAGEIVDHAQLVKVYPRKATLGAQFNGCQNLWLYARGKDGASQPPVDSMRLYFEHGKVTAARIGGAMCRYAATGSPAAENGSVCPLVTLEAIPSQPAGCITGPRSRSGESCDDDS